LPLEIQTHGPGYQGFLVIDSVVHQTSSGGVRVAPDLEKNEICDLAREMTLKYAWCWLPRGGAKAGLRLEGGLDAIARQDAFLHFGSQLAPIIHAGLYYPGMDLGCSADDLRSIYRGAGILLGPPTDTSYFTAITVAQCILAWSATHPGPSPRTLVIQGFGSVAGHLTSLLDASQFRVVGIATAEGGCALPEGFSPQDLAHARSAHRDALVHHLPGRTLSREDVIGVEADVFLPAARTRSLSPIAAGALRSRTVIPIANAPYGEGVPAQLHARGIPCLPGYVVNCGGVYASSLYDSGVGTPEIHAIFESRYRPIVEKLFTVSAERKCSPIETADGIAQRSVRVRSEERLSRADKIRTRTARRLPQILRRRAARARCLDGLDRLQGELDAMERS
jgi:glutamate dehydrogenase (NAD(P)+)